MLLGLLSKKYKPLVNQKAANKESLKIKLATNLEALEEAPLYCDLLEETLKEKAIDLWKENEDYFTPPEFEIVGVENGASLGLASLGLHDE